MAKSTKSIGHMVGVLAVFVAMILVGLTAYSAYSNAQPRYAAIWSFVTASLAFSAYELSMK